MKRPDMERRNFLIVVGVTWRVSLTRWMVTVGPGSPALHELNRHRLQCLSWLVIKP